MNKNPILNIHRAEDVIVDYCKKALKDDCEPVRLYRKGTKEHLTRQQFINHLNAAIKIGYPAKVTAEKYRWDYHDQDAETFWSGVASHLTRAEQPEKTGEYLSANNDFAFLEQQANCRRATVLLFGVRRRKDMQTPKAVNVRMNYSRTFENETWNEYEDTDPIKTSFPRAVRNLILGSGEKQLGYTREEYEIAERAFFEYAVTAYLRLMTNSNKFDAVEDRDKAQVYIDKFFNQLEKDAA